jgi:hypothetical protein
VVIKDALKLNLVFDVKLFLQSLDNLLARFEACEADDDESFVLVREFHKPCSIPL